MATKSSLDQLLSGMVRVIESQSQEIKTLSENIRFLKKCEHHLQKKIRFLAQGITHGDLKNSKPTLRVRKSNITQLPPPPPLMSLRPKPTFPETQHFVAQANTKGEDSQAVPFKCSKCPARFLSDVRRQEHEKIHLNKKDAPTQTDPIPLPSVGPSIKQSVSIPSVSEVKPQTVPVSVPHPSPPLSPPIPTMDKDRVVICEPSPYWPTSKTEIDPILSKNSWNTAWPPGKVATPLSYLGNVFEALLGT